MGEDLTDYLAENEVRVCHPHSEIHSIELIEIIQDLRMGNTTCFAENLLRESLDLPEVILVAILDADKEGLLRAERSLIQTICLPATHGGSRVALGQQLDRLHGKGYFRNRAAPGDSAGLHREARRGDPLLWVRRRVIRF